MSTITPGDILIATGDSLILFTILFGVAIMAGALETFTVLGDIVFTLPLIDSAIPLDSVIPMGTVTPMVMAIPTGRDIFIVVMPTMDIVEAIHALVLQEEITSIPDPTPQEVDDPLKLSLITILTTETALLTRVALPKVVVLISSVTTLVEVQVM